MKLIINRILYSFYCLNQCIFNFLDWIFKPLVIYLCKFFYKWDPFNRIKIRNNDLEEFILNTHKMTDEARGNVDYGLSIMSSQSDLTIIFIPYFVCLLKLLFKDIAIGSSLIYFWISALLSFIICWYFSFRNDLYKKFFLKFRKVGHNAKWNLLTFILICGFLYTFYISLSI